MEIFMVSIALELVRRSVRHSDHISEIAIVTAFSLGGIALSLALAHLGFDLSAVSYN